MKIQYFVITYMAVAFTYIAISYLMVGRISDGDLTRAAIMGSMFALYSVMQPRKKR